MSKKSKAPGCICHRNPVKGTWKCCGWERLSAEAICDQATPQIHRLVLSLGPLVLVNQSSESGAFARSALQFLLLGGVWENTNVNIQLSPLWSRSPLQRSAEGTELFLFPRWCWLHSNNAEIYSSFSDNKMQLYGSRSSCGLESPTQTSPFGLGPRECWATSSPNLCPQGWSKPTGAGWRSRASPKGRESIFVALAQIFSFSGWLLPHIQLPHFLMPASFCVYFFLV